MKTPARKAILKICGLTRRVDAEAALRHGATHLGFVFYPGSPRALKPEQALEIHKGLGGVKVGVFVNETPAGVLAAARVARLDAVQLCGAESPGDFADFPYPIWRTLRDPGALPESRDWPHAELFVLDLAAGDHYGGTGLAGDDGAAARFAARHRAVLAGGLTPDNVARRIGRVLPAGADVSSGVESAPGIKDERKISAFLAAAIPALPRLQKKVTT